MCYALMRNQERNEHTYSLGNGEFRDWIRLILAVYGTQDMDWPKIRQNLKYTNNDKR